MAFLEDKGVAAGTSAGTVDIFKVSALELHGPRDPFQKLQASGYAHTLAVLDNKGVAAGTIASTFDFFDFSALKMTWTQRSPEAAGEWLCLCHVANTWH